MSHKTKYGWEFVFADAGKGGVIALECWCVYFIPVGVLSYIHFGDKHREEN